MIRKFNMSDMDAVMDIFYQASLLAHPFLGVAFIEREKTNIRDIYQPLSETWVAEKDGYVIGFVSLIGNEVGGLFVYPDHHGKGIGRRLVDRAVKEKGNLEVVVFEKNSIGRAFYDRYGFREVERFFHDYTGQDCLKLAIESS